jgi:hypothetical protein
LIGLMLGTLLIAIGFRQLSPGDSLHGIPAWFFLVWSLPFFAAGFQTIVELVWGTQVREGAMEMLGVTRPWSQVVVKSWHERDDGFALRLSIVPSRPGATMTGGDGDIVVPVPASECAALEEFLRWRVTTTGRLTVEEDVGEFPGITAIKEGLSDERPSGFQPQ